MKKIAVIGSNSLFKIFESSLDKGHNFIHIDRVDKLQCLEFSACVKLVDWNDSFGIGKALYDLVLTRIR
jgi:hypothetical protein